MGRKTWLSYEAYLKSDVWKCGDSPTGAHHWIEIKGLKTRGIFYCKWCGDAKKFPLSLSEAMGGKHSVGLQTGTGWV